MRLLSVRETAESLDISRGTVYALCSAKLIRHERYGLGRGTIKIPEDAIDEYRQSVTIEKQPAARSSPPAPIRLKHLRL